MLSPELAGEKARIEHFEDLIAWPRARALAARVYELTRSSGLARDFGLADQLQRSAVSIMANIAEGFERSRLGEFHQFLSTAKGSCAELRSHLYLARDVGYLNVETFDILMAEAEELSRILGGLRSSVARQKAARG